MKSFIRILQISLIVTFLFFWLNSCASSKPSTKEETAAPSQQDDYDEIEQLLGISPEDKQPAAEESGEDDLLQLLQANESSGSTTETSEPSGSGMRMEQLQAENEDLKAKLQEKNKTISTLRAQVMAMEEGQQTGREKGGVVISGQPDMSDADYERTYQQGYQLAMERQFKDAIRVFETLLASNPRHSLADNAQYWIGECYYALGDYRAAILAFEKVFTFKNSNKNDYAQYKLGLCYFMLNDRNRAREEFQSLIDNYKNPTLVSKAEEYMARL